MCWKHSAKVRQRFEQAVWLQRLGRPEQSYAPDAESFKKERIYGQPLQFIWRFLTIQHGYTITRREQPNPFRWAPDLSHRRLHLLMHDLISDRHQHVRFFQTGFQVQLGLFRPPAALTAL